MVQSAMRNKDLSFDVFAIDAMKNVFDLHEDTVAMMRTDAPGEHGPLQVALHTATKASLRGRAMTPMNQKAIERLVHVLNQAHEDGLQIPDLFLWVQDLVTYATACALFGKAHPLGENDDLMKALWYITCLVLLSTFC